MPTPSSRNALLARLAVALASLWILVGALYKLLDGSPADLPQVVRDVPIGIDLLFKLVIAIELSVVALGLFAARLGWFLVALQYAVFVAILVPLVRSGAKSCGCLGSVTMPPGTMLAIDLACLALLLATRPWKSLPPLRRSAARVLFPSLLVVAAWVGPWWMLHGASDLSGLQKGVATAAGERPAPRYATLDPEDWVGRSISETPLARLMDVSAYPGDATWILYSVTCEHCAAYLQRLEAEFAADPRFYVFVRLSKKNEEAEREVTVMPPGEEAKLSDDIQYVITPPWELVLAGGVVQSARFRGSAEAR